MGGMTGSRIVKIWL